MPVVHVMICVQSGPHEAPGVLHGLPAWGGGVGQPAAGVAQFHCGGSMVWQIGYSEPPLQALHQQREPSPYQQVRVGSMHVLPGLACGIGQSEGSGAAEQLGSVPELSVTCHIPDLHDAVWRHCGRGSSP